MWAHGSADVYKLSLNLKDLSALKMYFSDLHVQYTLTRYPTLDLYLSWGTQLAFVIYVREGAIDQDNMAYLFQTAHDWYWDIVWSRLSVSYSFASKTSSALLRDTDLCNIQTLETLQLTPWSVGPCLLWAVFWSSFAACGRSSCHSWDNAAPRPIKE